MHHHCSLEVHPCLWMTAVYCVRETSLHGGCFVDSTCCAPLISLRAAHLPNYLCACPAREKTSLISRRGPTLSPERRVAGVSQKQLVFVSISTLGGASDNKPTSKSPLAMAYITVGGNARKVMSPLKLPDWPCRQLLCRVVHLQ